jgi:hypothetical protein
MVMNHEIADIIYGSPFINDAIITIALLCNIVAFVVGDKTAKGLLAASCIIALCMPVYDFTSGYVEIISSGESVPEPFTAAVVWLVFSPTNLVLVVALGSINAIRRIKRWLVIVFLSIVTSWFGIACLHYMAN